MAQTNPFTIYDITDPSKDASALLPGQQAVKPETAQPAPVRQTPTSNSPTRDDVIRRAADLGVDPSLALSIWSQESSSGRNPSTSDKGARGGFQVVPDTFRSMLGDADQGNAWNNMEAGLRYIAYGQKTLGTRDPALLAAGYHAGYDRKDLKAGRIPNTSDGHITTAEYAAQVAARAGKQGAAPASDASRYVPLSDAELAKAQQDGSLDAARFQPLSDDEYAAAIKGGAQVAQEVDQAPSLTTSMPRDVYEQQFRQYNPGASAAAVDYAMGQYDQQSQDRAHQNANSIDDRFKTLQNPQAMFDQRLNAKLQGQQNGVVPPLPGELQPAPIAAYDEQKAAHESALEAAASYLGKSAKAGMYDLAGAGAKVLDAINPWTLSESDAAVLFKDDPAKLKQLQDDSAAMILSRFAKHMTKNSDESMTELSDRAKRDYGSLEYATTDTSKAAYMSPTKVIGDAIRSLPTTAAMAVSVYLTRGAAARAEQEALAAGMSEEAARQAAVQAGAKAMANAGAVSEGATGYAQQANQSAADAEKVPMAELAKSPKFQQLLKEGFTPETARAKIIADTGEEAGRMAGIVDAAVNHVGGEFLGKILTEGGKLIPRIMKGAANESATEFVQSAGEQIGQNRATQENINPKQDLLQGVGEQAVAGAVVGGVMGGAAAGAGGRGHVEAAAPAVAAQPAQAAPVAAAVVATPPSTASNAAGPLSRSLENAAEQHAGQDHRVTATAPNGEQVSGQIRGMVENADGSFTAQILGDDGQMHTLDSRTGVQLDAEKTPDAGPLSAALSGAAEQHAAEQAPAAPVEAPATPAPVETPAAPAPEAAAPAAEPAPAAKPAVPTNIAEMSDQQLQDRLLYIRNQAKESGWDKRFVDARTAVEREITKRASAAPTTEASNVTPANDGRGSDSTAARNGPDNSGRSGANGPLHGHGSADAGLDGKQAANDLPAASGAANGQPALKNPYLSYSASSAERAQTYMDKRGADPAKFEVKQTGPVRWQVVPKQETAPAGWQDKVAKQEAALQAQIATANDNAAKRAAAKAAQPQSEIDTAAHEAATSPLNDLPEPTQAQKEAGNYQKGHVNVHGMDVTIENPRGSERSGQRPDGTTWSHTMSDHYGYIRRTEGADGEHIDTYIGPKPESDRVYVIDQLTQQDGSFDEHKVMLGFNSRDKAVAAYKSNFDKGWKVGPVKGMSVDEFKTWLKQGDTTKPVSAATTTQGAENGIDNHPNQQPNGAEEVGRKASEETSGAKQASTQALQEVAPAKLEVRETRGSGARFHGTSNELPGGQPNNDYAMNGDSRNIYGQGFYTTDAADISKGYMRKGRGGSPTLYEVGERGKVKLYNMEAPLTPEMRQMLDNTMGDAPTENDETGEPLTNLREVFDEYRARSQGEGLTRNDVQDAFDSVRDNLEQQGYRGYQHTGGLKTKNKPHEVRIYWNPEDDINVTKSDITKYEGEAAPAAAEKVPEVAPKQEPRRSTDQKVAAEKPATTKAEAPIADFGEKIHGARKDVWASFQHDMKAELPSDLKEITLAKHFPEPNYQALIDAGADPSVLAAVKAIRDEIPAKPRMPHKVRRWGEQVQQLRGFANDLLDGKYTAEEFHTMLRTHSGGALRQFADRVQMYADLGHPLFTKAKDYSIEQRHYTMFNGESPPGGITKYDLSVNGRSAHYDTRQEAMDALRKGLGAPTEQAAKTVQLDLYRTAGGDIIIGKKVGPGKFIDLKTGFTSVKDARAYLAEHREELVKALEQKKDVRPERRTVNSPRVGEDRRMGADVAPEQFGETFGFRGVQFGNYVEQKRRAADLNNAYDALLDMADVTGIPPKAISLNGTLGLAFGARGAGGKNAAAAHYEPGHVVINLTKTNGAGSLAHEWWHGLDNYFARQRGDNDSFITAAPRQKMKPDENRKMVPDESIRPETLDAFNGVVQAIRDSGMVKRSRDLDSRRSKDYWSTVHELTARAFESYVIDKAGEQGRSNDYLANIVPEPAHMAMNEAIGDEQPFPYPTRAEAPAINAAFDKLFATLQTKEEGGKVALYSLKDGTPQAEFGPVHTEFRDDAAGAVKRLMADKGGEAIVHRDGLGDVSLVYGDSKAGLAHIATRRGAEFMKQLPKLLEDGSLYSKPGQPDRVFIGTDSHEAVLRLQWDGQAKTWLLSAYEKYPNLKPAGDVQESRRSQVVDERTAEPISKDDLRAAVTKGVLGQVVHSMIDANMVVLHDTPKTLPRNVGHDIKGIQAVTTPDGKIHLVASNLSAKNANAVLLHEAFHQGADKLLGTEQWGALMGRMGSLYRQGQETSGKANEFWSKARDRVAAAKAKGGVSTKMEVEEFAAYAIEEYESAPTTVKKWVDDLIGMVKAWLAKRFGKQLGDVTPAQLSAFAKWALMDHAVERRGEIFGDIGTLFSLADDTHTTTAPAAPPGPKRYTPPEQGKARRLQAAVQDNLNRVTEVQNKIKELTGRTTLGPADYRGAEVNRPGRIAARLEDATDKLTKPLMTELAKSGYKPEQLSELLHAQHAEERNEAVARINPEFPDGGSGMTNDQAQAIIQNYKDAKPLQKLANKARAIAKATLDLKLAYGLIKPTDHEMLSTMYQNYVPLKGDGEYGPKIKRAMGHEGRDEHILENIARDYDQAVVVGEKNLARQSLLRTVLQFPDEELWTARVPPRGRYVAGKSYSVEKNGKSEAVFTSMSQVSAFLEGKGAAASNYTVMDSAGERVVEFTKPLQDNEVMVYVNGDPVRLQIHDEKLAAQLRPLDAKQIGPILENFRKVNRWLSAVYTGYNPAFILRNAARDSVTGSINMLGNEGLAVAAKAWTKYPGAVAELGKWAATKKESDSKTGRYLKEYRMYGGKTGASHMSDLDQQTTKLKTMFDNAYGASGYLKDGMAGKAALVAGRKIVGGMAHVVEVANQATENGLRLALYIALREEGRSADSAAQAAKSVTVDFDRKGSATGALGAIYLFFNPAVQGTANMARTLIHGHHKQQAWAAVAGLAALGFWAASKGMDDDKDRWLGEGWDTRTKNLIISGDKHKLQVPMSQEYAPAYAFGVAMAEAMHGESKTRSAMRMVSSFIDAYFPLQGAFREGSDNHLADAAQAATPTVLKPLVEAAMNRNSFGNQVVPETEQTKDKPDNLKMYRGTKGSAYDAAAQGIGQVGQFFGAGKYENDITKVSPETLKSLWRTYTGGLGQFITDSAGLAAMTAKSPGEVETGDVPIVKDFVKTNDSKAIRSRYYDVSKEARAAITEFQQIKKAGDGEALETFAADPEKLRVVGLGNMVTKVNKAEGAMGDVAVTINANKDMTTAEKRAALKELDQQQEALYREALGAFK